MEIKRDSGCKTFSVSVWHRKGSIDVGEDNDNDEDDDNDSGEEEGKGAWTFPEIHWKLLKALIRRDRIRFTF